MGRRSASRWRTASPSSSSGPTGTRRRSRRTACRARSRRWQPRAAADGTIRAHARPAPHPLRPRRRARRARPPRRRGAARPGARARRGAALRCRRASTSCAARSQRRLGRRSREAKRAAKDDPAAAARADGADRRDARAARARSAPTRSACGRSASGSTRPCCRCRTCRTSRRRWATARRTPRSSVKTSASSRPSASSRATTSELAERLDRHGARRPHVGLALRLRRWATSRGCGSRIQQLRPRRTCTEQGFTIVLPPVMVREETMFGTGFFPTDRQSVYSLADDDLYLVGTSEVPLAAFHQGEILAEAELPLRYCGALGLLPARGRRGGARHARHLPHAPVREGRDVLVLPPRSLVGRARLDAVDRGGDRADARPPLPRRQHRGGRPGRVGGQEVRHRGVAAGPGPLPRADELLQLHRLPGPPAARRATGPRAARRASCTPSTAPP